MQLKKIATKEELLDIAHAIEEMLERSNIDVYHCPCCDGVMRMDDNEGAEFTRVSFFVRARPPTDAKGSN